MTTLNYQNRLISRIQSSGNSICMGLDPVLSRIPLQGRPADIIKTFYFEILDEMVKQSVYPAVIKPNIAFYEAFGPEALQSLQKIIHAFKSEGVMVILDAKRGDIGKTAKAYAEMAFSVFQADAVTVAPYMGLDSVRPFMEHPADGGIYVLARTSNPSAVDFQSLVVEPDARPLYQSVARKIAEWDKGNLGAVVGATAPEEMEMLLQLWKSLGVEIPMLIPGVSVGAGGQGGSIKQIQGIIAASGSKAGHVINSSSGLNFAWEKQPDVSYAQASVNALKDMIVEMQG